jgi:hypothetical protein
MFSFLDLSNCPIVARHEVPGNRCREPRPGGTAEVVVCPRNIGRRNGVHAALEARGIPVERYVGVSLSPDLFNRPAGTGYLLHHPRHFVPGYYRAVPPGQNTLIHSSAEALLELAFMG